MRDDMQSCSRLLLDSYLWCNLLSCQLHDADIMHAAVQAEQQAPHEETSASP